MLRSYVRQYRMPLIFALLLYLICLAVLLLSALPIHAVLYALGLSGVLGLTMLFWGYFPYARRHKLLRELDIRDSLEHLPQPVSSIEEDYQALLGQLFAEKEAAKTAATDRYNNTLDYFTLWAHQIKTPISAMDLILQAGEGSSELKGELFKVQQYVSMALNFLRLGEGIWTLCSGNILWMIFCGRRSMPTPGSLSGQRCTWTLRRPTRRFSPMKNGWNSSWSSCCPTP